MKPLTLKNKLESGCPPPWLHHDVFLCISIVAAMHHSRLLGTENQNQCCVVTYNPKWEHGYIRAKGHSVDKMKLGRVAIVVQAISKLKPIIVITCP